MRKHALSTLALGLLIQTGAVAVATAADLPLRYSPRNLDGRLRQIESPATGTVWSAWAYRSGAEYDIALSMRSADGSWTEPEFLGFRDGQSQVDPTIATDASGNLYLAFAVQESGQIKFSTLPAGSRQWSEPMVLRLGTTRASSPLLRVVGDRLVLAYWTRSGIAMIDVSLLPPMEHPIDGQGINDGPDPVQLPGAPEPTDPEPPSGNNAGGNSPIRGREDAARGSNPR